MAQAVTATILAQFVANLTQAVGLSPAAAAPVNDSVSYSFSNGSGANQAGQLWSSSQRSIAGSGSETLDLSGSLTDAFGNSIVLTKVKAIMIVASALNVNDVVVGGVGANGWVSPFGSTSDKVNVKPGGMMLLVAPDANGYGVTAATADLLKVANSAAGAAVLYDIIVMGV